MSRITATVRIAFNDKRNYRPDLVVPITVEWKGDPAEAIRSGAFESHVADDIVEVMVEDAMVVES
jgi:hypothetical protein